MLRSEIINLLARKFNYKSYLEIGLANTHNFRLVNVQHKESCDPYFLDKNGDNGELVCADSNGELLPFIKECLTYRMTSDEMFEQMPSDKKFDIIFIDGLHEAIQTARDIVNASKHLTENGVILCHDCLPPNELFQMFPRPKECDHSGWNGNSWMAVASLKHFNVQFDVINEDWGVGVIFNSPQLQDLGYYDPYKLVTWDDYVSNRDNIMNVINPSSFFTD